MIGIFDSGIGGLTVLKAVRDALPSADIAYLGDTARVPYGIRSPEIIVRYSLENAHFLLSEGIEMLVVACNTASAHALPALTRDLTIPVIGVVEPGARGAVDATRGGGIGVLGTAGTIASGAYTRAIAAISADASVHGQACPLFVPLVEEGWLDNDIARRTAEVYLRELHERAPGVDTLVLGCTHYPLLITLLESVAPDMFGHDVALIDSASQTARAVAQRMALQDSGREGSIRYFVTDFPERFQSVGGRFLGAPIDAVTRVTLDGGDAAELSATGTSQR